jgi:hypothetical protein
MFKSDDIDSSPSIAQRLLDNWDANICFPDDPEIQRTHLHHLNTQAGSAVVTAPDDGRITAVEAEVTLTDNSALVENTQYCYYIGEGTVEILAVQSKLAFLVISF